MEKSDIYKIELDGNLTWITYDEVSCLKRDILLYYDTNHNNESNPFVPNILSLSYWEYLSCEGIDEESSLDAKLIAHGSLCIINGILEELLDEILEQGKMNNIMMTRTYINQIKKQLLNLQPNDDTIKEAKEILLLRIESITTFSNNIPPSKKWNTWFNQTIIDSYFRSKITT